jgi:hypothetical protein
MLVVYCLAEFSNLAKLYSSTNLSFHCLLIKFRPHFFSCLVVTLQSFQISHV